MTIGERALKISRELVEKNRIEAAANAAHTANAARTAHQKLDGAIDHHLQRAREVLASLSAIEVVERRIAACRAELAELKRLKRAVVALGKADEAKREREMVGVTPPSPQAS
jgi:flavin-binding protein dodecin